jgi:hypothetical protein
MKRFLELEQAYEASRPVAPPLRNLIGTSSASTSPSPSPQSLFEHLLSSSGSGMPTSIIVFLDLFDFPPLVCTSKALRASMSEPMWALVGKYFFPNVVYVYNLLPDPKPCSFQALLHRQLNAHEDRSNSHCCNREYASLDTYSSSIATISGVFPPTVPLTSSLDDYIFTYEIIYDDDVILQTFVGSGHW